MPTKSIRELHRAIPRRAKHDLVRQPIVPQHQFHWEPTVSPKKSDESAGPRPSAEAPKMPSPRRHWGHEQPRQSFRKAKPKREDPLDEAQKVDCVTMLSPATSRESGRQRSMWPHQQVQLKKIQTGVISLFEVTKSIGEKIETKIARGSNRIMTWANRQSPRYPMDERWEHETPGRQPMRH